MEMNNIQEEIKVYIEKIQMLQNDLKTLEDKKAEIIKEIFRLDGIVSYLKSKLSNDQNKSN